MYRASFRSRIVAHSYDPLCSITGARLLDHRKWVATVVTTVEASRLFTDDPGDGLSRSTRRRRSRSSRYVWEARYVRLLFGVDFVVSLLAGGLAYLSRFGDEVNDYNKSYLVLTAALPFVWILAAGL